MERRHPSEETDPNLASGSLLLRAEAQPRLVQLSGGHSGEVGRVVLLDKEQAVIGRAPDAALPVSDSGVSRRHAMLERSGEKWRVVDLGSRNGTYVNGARVKDAELRDGDRIQIGSSTLLRFSSAPGEEDWLRKSLARGGVALWDYFIETKEVLWSEQADVALHLEHGTLARRRMDFLSMVHRDDRAQVQSALAASIEKATPFELEFRVLPPARAGSDTSRWVLCRGHLLRDEAGKVSRINGTVIDVSERKKRDLDLGRMALIFESLSDGVFLTDEEGKIIDFNTAARNMFAIAKTAPASEVPAPAPGARARATTMPIVPAAMLTPAVGAELFTLLEAPSPRELERLAMKQIRKHGRWTAELQLARGGGERSFEVLGFPLRNEDEELGAAFLFRDITERKQLQTQVAFFDRLSSLGTLSAGIAHEINNPLAFVVGSIEFVMNELAEDEQRRQLLDALKDAYDGANRIAGIVRDLKAFSRDDVSSRPVPTDGRRALEMAIKMTQKHTATRARVTTDLASDVPFVDATESRLSQVFTNLLVNAAQAIPEGTEGEITVRQWSAGDFVLTEITDTGVGIPSEQLARIFDPFFTTKPVGSATGLGLSICHGLVTAFGGDLFVKSEVGKGTTFTVKLKASRASRPEFLTPAPYAQRRARILIVDDEPLLLRALTRTLAAHDITTRGTVDEALALLRAQDFDVIVCDLMMPGRSGMDLYEDLERERPELTSRVVFVTGGAFTERANRFLATVTNTTLTKPIDSGELSRVIQERLRDSTPASGVRLPATPS